MLTAALTEELKCLCIYTFSALLTLPQSLLGFVALHPSHSINSLLILVSHRCSGYFRPSYQFQPENSLFHQVMNRKRPVDPEFDEYFKSLVWLAGGLLILQLPECYFSIDYYFPTLQSSHYSL